MGTTDSDIYDLVIVGGGPAGLSAALYGARCGMRVVLIEKGVVGGHAAVLARIDDYPGVKDADGWELTRVMEKQVREAGAEIVEDEEAVSVSSTDEKVCFTTLSGKDFHARTCIIATGGEPEALDVPGAKRFDRKGIHTCAQCAGPAYKGKRVAVYGNNNQALAAAGHLLNIAEDVYLIIEEREPVGDAALLAPLLESPRFHLMPGMRVSEIIGDSLVEAVILKKSGEDFDITKKIDALFVYRRFIPRTSLTTAACDAQGFLRVDGSLQTSLPGIFAAGFVCDPDSRLVTAMADGVRAAGSAFRVLRET